MPKNIVLNKINLVYKYYNIYLTYNLSYLHLKVKRPN